MLKLKLKSSHYLCFRFEPVVCYVITVPIGNAFYSCIRFANAVGSFEHFLSKVFCVPPSLFQVDTSMDRDSLVEGYFRLGIDYVEILAFLIMFHGIRLSMRQLKRILRERGLARRK